MSSGVSATSKKVGDAALVAATGKSEAEWFAMLDAAKATEWTHAEIARWLFENNEAIDGWWSQGVTVRYEQARGMRMPGQMADGTFTASTSKSVAVDQSAALDAVIAVLIAELGSQPASVNRTTKFFTARWKFDGGEVLLAQTDPTVNGKTGMSLTRSKIADPETLGTVKSRLTQLVTKIADSIG